MRHIEDAPRRTTPSSGIVSHPSGAGALPRYRRGGLVFAMTWSVVSVALLVSSASALGQGTVTVTKSPRSDAGTITGTVIVKKDPVEMLKCGDMCTTTLDAEMQECLPGTPPDCSWTIPDLVLTAKPSTGWQLSRWSGCDMDQDLRCHLGPKEHAQQATAHFADVGKPTIVTLTGPAEGQPIGGEQFAFGATATDNWSVDRVEFLAGDQEFAEDSTGPDFTADFDPRALPDWVTDGQKVRITARAVDPANNSGSASREYVIDRTPPRVSILWPAGPTPIGGVALVPHLDVYDLHAGSAPASCMLDGEGPQSCARLALPQGVEQSRTLSVRATDQAGNVTEATRAFTLDTLAPRLTVTNGPAREAPVQTDHVAFAFGAEDATAVDLGCVLGDGALTPCASPHTLTSLPDGPHIWRLRAEDAAGNVRWLERGFSVDAVRPAVEIISGPAEGTTTAATSATFRFRGTDVASVRCAVDGEVLRACTAADFDTIGPLRDGVHSFRVEVRDAAGAAATAARTFRVDTSRPQTRIDAGPANGSVRAANSVTFSFSSTDPKATFECRFGRRSRLGAAVPCSGPGNTHTVRGLREGAYEFEVRSTNALGTPDDTPARRRFSLIKPTSGLPVDAYAYWRRVGRDGMRPTNVYLARVPAAASVEVSCRGRGCAFTRKTVRAQRGVAKLTRLFRGGVLKPGARVEVRVTMRGAVGRLFRYTVQRGDFPDVSGGCLPPGSRKPRRCR
jgi:Bacterial Ig domain